MPGNVSQGLYCKGDTFISTLITALYKTPRKCINLTSINLNR